MSRNSVEKSHAGITRRRFLRLGSGLLVAATGLALLPAGAKVFAEENSDRGIPYGANDSLRIHHKIVTEAMKNARFEQQGEGVISESYYTPGGELENGKLRYGVRKWDHLHFSNGLPEDPTQIETLTSFKLTPETVGWKININGNRIDLTHLYNPNGTPWIPRNEYLTSLQLKDSTLPMTLTRVFSFGGEVEVLRIIIGDTPPDIYITPAYKKLVNTA